MTRKDDGDGGTKPPYYGVRLRPVRIDDELWEAVKKVAADRGEPVSEVIRACLRRYVQRHSPKE